MFISKLTLNNLTVKKFIAEFFLVKEKRVLKRKERSNELLKFQCFLFVLKMLYFKKRDL